MLWPDGKPVCRHCGSVNAYKMVGATCRPGLCRCRDCQKQFTVTVGTVFEDTHLPLSKWVRAIHLISTSKKGISSLQLMRNLGLGSYQSAWFMSHRIRLAMKRGPQVGLLKGTVEVDETYVGGKPRKTASGEPTGKGHVGRGTKKTPVVALVERNGNVRAHPIQMVDSLFLKTAIRTHVDRSAAIMTDEWPAYRGIGNEFDGGHQVIHHGAGEYARGNVNTNTSESFFALLKRGVHGTFHHVSVTHLHRYCDEFSFRWDGRKMTDVERRDMVMAGVVGKRMVYRKMVAGN
jgi:transposase-like protein